MNGAPASAAGGDCANWKARMGLSFATVFLFLRGRNNHVNRSKVPVHTHRSWVHGECGLVAESTEPENPAPALPPVRSYGQGVQLRGRVQEPRPECRDQGPACLDDGLAGLVAGRLWPLWATVHSYGVAQRGYVPHRRWPRWGWSRSAALRAAQ